MGNRSDEFGENKIPGAVPQVRVRSLDANMGLPPGRISPCVREEEFMLERIAEGRTDLVFEYVAQGHPASARTSDGRSLLQWCAYY